MKRIDEMTLEERKRLARWGIVFVICVFAIGILGLYVLVTFVSSPFGLHEGSMSLFSGSRMILIVFCPLVFLPVAVLCELFDSRFNKRPFKVRNAIIFLLFFGEFVVTAIISLTLLDIGLSGISFLIQFPLTAVCISIPLIIVVFTFRLKKVQGYLHREFKSGLK